jgi:peptide/nickel transport system substrate-binding protein
MTRDTAADLIAGLKRGEVSRRAFIKSALALGLSLPTVMAWLQACAPAAVPPEATATAAPPGPTPAPTPVPVTPTPEVGGTLIYATNTEGRSMNLYEILAASNSHYVFGTVYEPLYWKGPDLQYYPGLATSWSASADGKVWTYELRQGVTFHDGNPWNAGALKYILEYAAKEGQPFLASFHEMFESGEVVNEHTLKLNLNYPSGVLMDLLASPFITMISPAAIEEYGVELTTHASGTGPYILKEWVEKDHTTYIRNPEYNWGPAFLDNQGPPYFNEFRSVPIPETTTMVAALETGEVHVIDFVPGEDAVRLRESGFQVNVNHRPGTPIPYRLNCQRPPTDDVRVRLAMNYATDREELVNSPVYRGLIPPQYGVLTEFTWGYDADVTAEYGYRYDPAKAKALLDEAGWVEGPDGVRQKDGEKLSVVCVGWADTPEGLMVDEIIQSQLLKVGINVELRPLLYAALVEATDAGEHNMVLWNSSGSDPDTCLGRALASKNIGASGQNVSKYSNPVADELLERGAATVDLEERLGVYSELQKVLLQDAPIIPIAPAMVVSAAQPNLVGLKFSKDAMAGFWFNDVRLT